MDDRHDYLVQMAKLGENCERYDDMAGFMRELVETLKNGQRLTPEERNLLSVAYKNIVGTRRNAWRTIEGAEASLGRYARPDKDELPVEVKAKLCQDFKKVLEKELVVICNGVISLLDDHLLVDPGCAESEVFYQKMKGDYYRYQVEVASGDDRKNLTEKSKEAYNAAWNKATESLEADHPIRLGLALNFSVFYYEIDNKTKEACDLAKKACEDGMEEITKKTQLRAGQMTEDDERDESSHKDSSLILQLLGDNLALWRNDCNVDDDEQEAYQQEEN